MTGILLPVRQDRQGSCLLEARVFADGIDGPLGSIGITGAALGIREHGQHPGAPRFGLGESEGDCLGDDRLRGIATVAFGVLLGDHNQGDELLVLGRDGAGEGLRLADRGDGGRRVAGLGLHTGDKGECDRLDGIVEAVARPGEIRPFQLGDRPGRRQGAGGITGAGLEMSDNRQGPGLHFRIARRTHRGDNLRQDDTSRSRVLGPHRRHANLDRNAGRVEQGITVVVGRDLIEDPLDGRRLRPRRQLPDHRERLIKIAGFEE